MKKPTLRFLPRTSLLFSVLILISTTSSTWLHADEFVWTGAAGNGTWNDPGNWTNTTPGGTATFPDGDDNVSFNIDATTTSGSAENVTIANAATLAADVGRLTFGPGTITNNGVLTFEGNAANAIEQYVISDAVTLTGNGELVLVEEFDSSIASRDAIFGGDTSVADVLTNAAGHTIRGAGQIDVSLNNQGTIIADQTGQALTLSGSNSTNASSITATTGAILSDRATLFL